MWRCRTPEEDEVEEDEDVAAEQAAEEAEEDTETKLAASRRACGSHHIILLGRVEGGEDVTEDIVAHCTDAASSCLCDLRQRRR